MTEAGMTSAAVSALMEFSMDAVVTRTRQGMITGWNSGAADLYGYRAEEIIGRYATVLVPAGFESEEAELLRRAAAGERIAPYSANRVRKDGAIISTQLAMAPIVDDTGAIIGVASTSRLLAEPGRASAEPGAPHEDRERLRAQLEQAQRLEGLGQLAGGVAHDFNNLIAVILNYAAFVGEEIDTAAAAGGALQWKAVAADVAQIRLAAERAAGLTRQLLSFSRREVAQPEVICLNDMLGAIAGNLRRTLGADRRLITHLGADLPPVMADQGQLEQAILNMAVNARDAMPDGGSLTITTDGLYVDREFAAEWSAVLPGHYARVQISDTGLGMTPEVLKHAFEPFYTTKSKGAGSGLGLASVYGTITQAEGHVRIESEPGHGTTFTILLPVTNQPASECTRPIPGQQGAPGGTILIVEDEDALREVTRRLLTRQGYQIITATNGAEAVAAADSYPDTIHLLLTDVIMPGMLGKEVAQTITAGRPGLRVLYMSGYAQPILASQGRLDPHVILLDKPFTETELLAKVGDVLAAQPSASRA